MSFTSLYHMILNFYEAKIDSQFTTLKTTFTHSKLRKSV